MSGLASHLPLALSLLQTVASQYPSLQKAQPTPPVTQTVIPSAPPAPPPPLPRPAQQNPPSTNQSSSNSLPLNPPNAPSSIGTPPSVATSALCQQCHIRAKYFDGTRTHPYCSKTCAKGATPSSSANCDFCHNRPKYSDGTKTHPYCGKACAKSASAQYQSKPSLQRSGTLPPGNGKGGKCLAPGCGNPGFTNSNGATGDYCSLSHKTLVETLCLMCLKACKTSNSHFCSQKCTDDADKKGPLLLEVPVGHVTFKSVADQFKASWRHAGTNCPPVKRVYKIMSSTASLTSYNNYRSAVETRGQFVAAGRSAGNENRRWHGTRRECTLGDGGKTTFCASPSCSLCCIVKTSFDLGMWGKKTGWGRFGKGIYTSSTSSKSNDYSHNDCKSPFKAILLNKVVVGKGCKLTQDNVSLTSPPAGYDSVLAEKGGSLNYDELVVYTNDAIRPSFLVIYEP